MRTITMLLTVIACQLSATYIPSTVYVQRSSTKITEPQFAKRAQARDNYGTDASFVIPNEGQSQTLSTAAVNELPGELYVLTPAIEKVSQVPPLRNCCITGK
jgi:hypothetical protein